MLANTTLAITTFSSTGYETYARKMLESVIKNWPSKIIVYVEKPIDIDTDNGKIEVRNFFDIEGAMNFYQNIKNTPVCHGMVNGKYNYNYDVWRFSRKMLAQWDVLKYYNGKVIWLDADSIIRKPVTDDWLIKLFDGKGLSYLGREGFHTETGFIGFDTENEKFREFLKYYIGFIRHGWFKDHKRWHDCEAFDFAREKSGISGNNLSPFFKIPKDRVMSLADLDVVERSVLGEYFFHAKGAKKKGAKPRVMPHAA